MKNQTTEKVFNKPIAEEATDAETQAAKTLGELVYVDKFMFVYGWNGRLYCMEPPDDLQDEVTELLSHDVTTDDWDRGMGEPHLGPGTADRAFERNHEQMKDPAKYEVEYNPAEVLHLMHEMAYSLREMYEMHNDVKKVVPSSYGKKKWSRMNEAHDLLERYRDEYLGGSWEEHDEQDRLYR